MLSRGGGGEKEEEGEAGEKEEKEEEEEEGEEKEEESSGELGGWLPRPRAGKSRPGVGAPPSGCLRG